LGLLGKETTGRGIETHRILPGQTVQIKSNQGLIEKYQVDSEIIRIRTNELNVRASVCNIPPYRLLASRECLGATMTRDDYN
jgi:hypothetical protein